MPPHHVRSLPEYWVWLERLIGSTGAWIRGNALVVEPVQEDEFGEWLIVRFRAQYLDFANGSMMQFALTVDDELNISRYSFHFQDAKNTLIWRKDNVHLQHGEHIHLPSRDPAPFPAVDLEEALAEAAEFIESGTSPTAN